MKKFLVAAVALSILLTGCTGPFTMTKKLHAWQTSFDDKWVDEVAFLGCAFLGPYWFTTLADSLVFNSVEFWTGENPMDNASAPQGDEMCLISVAEQM